MGECGDGVYGASTVCVSGRGLAAASTEVAWDGGGGPREAFRGRSSGVSKVCAVLLWEGSGAEAWLWGVSVRQHGWVLLTSKVGSVGTVLVPAGVHVSRLEWRREMVPTSYFLLGKVSQ